MVSVLSLSDKIISKCQFARCDLELVITPLGLCLRWLSNEDSKNNGKSLDAAIVTKMKIYGKLYPVCMNLVTEVAVFGKAVSNGSSDSCGQTPSTVLIVCASGSVKAAHSKLPGFLVTLCHVAQPVVWTGIMEVGDTSVIVVVGKNAIMAIGKPVPSSVLHTSTTRDENYGKGSLHWSTRTLTTAAVTCYGQKNALVFSDGVSCWLCRITAVGGDEMEVECHELSYNGVMQITCKNMDCIEMLTCDGRKYQCCWKVLTENNKSENKVCSNLMSSELPNTVEGMMTGIQQCSQLMYDEGKSICSLDIYLRQLSLAHRLLTEPRLPLFSTSVRVEHSIMQSSSYFAHIQFSKPKANINLEGKWWRLCIVVPGYNGDYFISAKLDSKCFATGMGMSVPIPALNLKNSLNSITIKCYLVLEHFSSFQPVCQVFACQAEVDIFHFLTCQRKLSTASLSFQTSGISLYKTFEEQAFGNYKSNINQNPVPFCKVCTSYITHETVTSLFESLFGLIPPLNLEQKNSEKNILHVSLWYHDDRIDIHCSIKDDRTLLTFEGPNPSVVLSLRAAIERRVMDLGLPSRSVTLTPEVLRQAHLVHRISNFEANSCTTPAFVSHFHHAVTQLISLLPL